MKKYSFILLALFISTGAFAQKLYTKAGNIKFVSDTPIETIEAINSRVACVVATEDNTMQWSALIKSFEFEKALMQEHFNENYMESNKYPKAIFSGEISEGTVEWGTDGKYEVKVAGTLEIHGVTQDVEVPALVMVQDGMISTTATFVIKPEDYEIKIPKVVRDNIAKEVTISVQAKLESL